MEENKDLMQNEELNENTTEEVTEPAAEENTEAAVEAAAEERTEAEKKKEKSEEEKAAAKAEKEAKKAEKAKAKAEAKAAKKAEKKKKRTKQQIKLAVFGFLACFFILIGVISSISFVWTGVTDLIENKELKEELGYAVFPLVIVDAPEFDSVEALESSVVVSTSVWRLILDADLNRYVKDDVGNITVPDVDVEYYIRQMYGADATVLHQTIPDALVEMSYDSEGKNYTIQSTPVVLPYSPRVDAVSQSGGIYTVKVSYLLPDVTWALTSYRNEIVEKEMEFTLKKTDSGWQVLSCKLLGVINEESSEPVSQPDEESLPEMSVEESSEESVEESDKESSKESDKEEKDDESKKDESSDKKKDDK